MEAGIARMRDGNLAETVIGAVLVAIAVLFIALIYTRTGSGGLSGYEIQARLNKVDGMAVGTDVRLAGVKIGSVSDLTLDPRTYLVTVHMNIRNDVKVPDDSSLLVTSSGLLGASYLAITPGGDDAMLKPGVNSKRPCRSNRTILRSSPLPPTIWPLMKTLPDAMIRRHWRWPSKPMT